MRKVVVGLLSAVLASGVGFSLPVVAVAAPPVVPPDAVPSGKAAKPASDEMPNPFEARRRALRQQAVANVVSGRAKVVKRGASSVVNMGKVNVTGAAGTAGLTRAAAGKDQYVEVGREKTDKLFVILAEFGNERHPDYPDYDVNPATAGPVVYDGPAHNKIPQPDRTVDNVTNWNANYSADYFRKMYFGAGKNVESLKTYFETQSSGRYSVNGKVSDWVKVKYNEARYGRSSDVPTDANGDDPKVCDDHVCSNSEQLVKDAANQWVAEQKKAGRTDAQIATDLKAFDVYDRYDFDADGNFNEPDGYLDHFQIVHAGGDEADGDPAAGRGRDLEPPRLRVRHRRGDHRPGRQQAGRLAGRHDRPVDRRLHHAAGERRPQRLHPRVRSRPRPARRLRHLRSGQQQQRLLDADGAEPARRQGRPGARHAPGRPRRVEQAAARLARLRDRRRRQGEDPEPGSAGVQQRQGAGRRGRPAEEAGDDRVRRTVRGHEAVLLRQPERLHQPDDPRAST